MGGRFDICIGAQQNPCSPSKVAMTDDSRHRKYFNFPEARRAHARGDNVTLHLQQQLDISCNTPDIIEIAYDLQAGSYVAQAKDQRARLDNYCADLAEVLAP